MNVALRRLLEIERSQVGIAESPDKSNNVKYNTAYYGHKVHNQGDTVYAWCVVFQWWCFQKAGIPTTIFPKSANVFAVRRWYRKRGLYDHKAQVGSLAIFTKSHIGLVARVLKDGSVMTIEGNTDKGGDRSGGRVMVKRRKSEIAGYCHPNYAKVPVRPKVTSRAVPHGAAVKQAVAQTNRPASVRQPTVPTHTAVTRADLQVPAGKVTAVQFREMTANTGGFWRAPKDARRGGYNLASGPGVYMASVTVQTSALPPGTKLKCELAQANPADHFKVVKRVPIGEIADTGGDTRTFTAMSSLGPGHHLWVRLICEEDIVLPSIAAEVVVLPA
jgi:CHAP domain